MSWRQISRILLCLLLIFPPTGAWAQSSGPLQGGVSYDDSSAARDYFYSSGDYCSSPARGPECGQVRFGYGNCPGNGRQTCDWCYGSNGVFAYVPRTNRYYSLSSGCNQLGSEAAWATQSPQVAKWMEQAGGTCTPNGQLRGYVCTNVNPVAFRQVTRNRAPSPLEEKPQVVEFPIPPQFNIFVPGLQNIADIINFLSSYHPVETAYVGIGIAGGRLAALGFPTTSVTVENAVARDPVQGLLKGNRFTGQGSPVNLRDARISRVAPPVKALNRAISKSSTQNQVLQDDIQALFKLDPPPTGIRVNQQQINAAGQRVGINRPDLQFTYRGQRYHVEYDTPPPVRALEHGARLLANDPEAIIILKTVP